jgi:hypothetical protein
VTRARAISGVTAILLLAACGGDRSATTDSAAAAPGLPSGMLAERPVNAAPVTREQFQSLAWLVGRWRGSVAGDSGVFFEQYDARNDSTIAVTTFSDSTFTVRSEESTLRYANGRVTTGAGTVSWVVTAFEPGKLTFESLSGAVAGFVWERQSDSLWIATLGAPGSSSRRVYEMRRIQ